ncbi:MAG: hypothetical protein M3372_01585 [Verrucomicrobiota bacterium]|nr:hypothetical protein [Verrucomicrobiota bacterium]
MLRLVSPSCDVGAARPGGGPRPPALWLTTRAILLLATACGALSCVSKPALPKRASLETAAARTSSEDFAALVPNADIIYFPTERAGSSGRSEPAARLLETLQRSGGPFAIAWDVVDAGQQPLLDSIAAKPADARERLIRTLELSGTGRSREHCRAVLREAGPGQIRHVALGFPKTLDTKIRSEEPLTPEEQQQVAGKFELPQGGLEAFTERLSTAQRAGDADVPAAYRAHVLRQQFAAGKIIERVGGAGTGTKLLVFLPEADLVAGQGVPYYVAQKVKLRQLVLGSDAGASGRTKLLTGLDGRDARSVEIVDRSPRPAGD